MTTRRKEKSVSHELSENAMEVLKERYLLKDENNDVIETAEELFERVAHAVAEGENNFKSGYSAQEVEEQFYSMLRSLELLPNSPTLMNAGTALGQLSACFVLPVEDSLDGIFGALHHTARIHQTGGGTGFDFSRLRPRGDIVSSTKGKASGPVSFMEIFDKTTEVIVQGGKRRGANMGILRCDHPDIFEFIKAKRSGERLSNFNVSVGATDAFMEAMERGSDIELRNTRTGKTVREAKAKEIFDEIVNAAWLTGDPGLIFLDEINRHNPTEKIGRIEATNPCGELPLLPYESCNLASINLAKMVGNGSADWERIRENVHWGVRFLDDVIEVNKFPLPQIEEITFKNRKIGLGVMGFADMLIRLGIPYNSKKAAEFARTLMRFIRDESIEASVRLADERGVFPNFTGSLYEQKGFKTRNSTVNTIAPTGTISIIAGCSSGIEPLFAITFVRNILSGKKLLEINPFFLETAKKKGFYHKALLEEIARSGSLKNIKGVPDEIKKVFATAFDVSPDQHLLIQAAFQEFTDNSVSKTINLPPQSTPAHVFDIYVKAHKLKCKGITIYRYGSKEDQVLTFDYRKKLPPGGLPITVDSEYSGGCQHGFCPF